MGQNSKGGDRIHVRVQKRMFVFVLRSETGTADYKNTVLVNVVIYLLPVDLVPKIPAGRPVMGVVSRSMQAFTRLRENHIHRSNISITISSVRLHVGGLQECIASGRRPLLLAIL